MAAGSSDENVSALIASPFRLLGPDEYAEIEFQLHGFRASATFAGARKGQVFKMGCLGLGYYDDVRAPFASDLLHLGASCKEIRAIVLAALVPVAKAQLRHAEEQEKQDVFVNSLRRRLSGALSGALFGAKDLRHELLNLLEGASNDLSFGSRARRFADVCGVSWQ